MKFTFKNSLYLKYILVIFLLYTQNNIAQISNDKIKIACVGNSVTYGAGIENRKTNSYPAQLQTMLGEKYEVRNFGKSGATLLKKGHNPYWEQEEFEKAKEFLPNIVIIHLGLNDTDPRNWPNYKDEFNADYRELIETFQNLPSSPKVFICKMTPIFHGHPRFKSGTRDWFWQIQTEIERVARTNDVGLIDLHSSLHIRPDVFPDNLHPIAEGAKVIAKNVYSEITGDYGGLKLSKVFGSKMVLQRNKKIPIWGTSNVGENIEVKLGTETKKVTTDKQGKWRVSFSPLEAGGPYELIVKNKHTTLKFSDILIGEVWLCSGQSNMDFELKKSARGEEEISKALNPKIRFYDMENIGSGGRVMWSDSILKKMNKLDAYDATWEESSPQSAEKFSAVAYYFGKMLYENLKVPIGLIHNSKGGSPTESWIDRLTLEHHPQMVNVLNDWNNNDFISNFCKSRSALNIKESNNPKQRHPFHPAYLYESNIRPLTNFPIKGVIWYQGESNAHNVEFHEILFPELVKNWRNSWGYDFPFYYVQLSSINRPTWGHFRDSQRRLMAEIPNSGMAISSDVGNPTDVHPKKKKEVGERLARWALANEYDIEIVKSGPLYKDMVVSNNTIIVSFDYDEGLKLSNDKRLQNFEIAGDDKIFKPAKAKIKGDKIILSSDLITKPIYVRYGWKPYFEGNLVNGVELPASTFSTEYEKIIKL